MADLRRKILETTRQLLVEEGYTNLSMRKIARATGHSATSIYLYFENKDTLFHALINEGFDLLYEELESRLSPFGEPVEGLEALCRGYIDFALRNPEYYEIMFLERLEKMVRYPVEKWRRARRNLELFARVLDAGKESGVFEIVDAWISAGVIWSTLHGVVSLRLLGRIDARVNSEALIEATIRHAVRGQLPHPEGLALVSPSNHGP